MKLWEVVSAFREFRSEVAAVFESERWRGTYGNTLSHFEELVDLQDRAALDSHVPVELTRDIARRCGGLKFWLSEDTGHLRQARSDMAPGASVTTLSALEVHDRFGGSIIEEVQEYGSAKVAGVPHNTSLERTRAR